MGAGWSTVGAMLASTERDFPLGTVLCADCHRYAVVDSREHLVTAGGVRLRVLPNANGVVSFLAFDPLTD